MKNNPSKIVFFIFVFFILAAFARVSILAQSARPEPELCVAGFCLGQNENEVKTKLQGYSPRYDNPLGQPKYFFYNQYGNQLMAITVHSKERPFLIVGIEMFVVDDSYQTKHYQLKDITAFTTESGFFLGLRPSASSMVFGIPNSSGPKEVIKKKGQPDSDEKPEKIRFVRYKLPEVKKLEALEANSNGVNFGSYTAEYRFYKNSLRRLIITVNASDLNKL